MDYSKKTMCILFACISFVFIIITNYIYSVESYIWNNDALACNNIKPYLHKSVFVHYTIFVINLCMLFLIYYYKGKSQRIIALVGMIAISCFAIKLDEIFLGKNNYFIWKYQIISEEYSDQAIPEISQENVNVFLRDLQDKNEAVRIRSKIALALGATDIREVRQVLKSIALNKTEDKYLRFNCLKSLKLINVYDFKITVSLLKGDSVICLYKKNEK